MSSEKIPLFDDVLLTDAVVTHGGLRYDRWIIGEGADSEIEYLVHLSTPRFICKMKITDDDEGDTPINGLSCDLGLGELLYDFIWLDAQPSVTDMTTLLAAAGAAIERDSLKSDIEDEEE